MALPRISHSVLNSSASICRASAQEVWLYESVFSVASMQPPTVQPLSLRLSAFTISSKCARGLAV